LLMWSVELLSQTKNNKKTLKARQKYTFCFDKTSIMDFT